MNDQIKLNNSETRIMNVLWEKGQLPAKEVALEAAARYGWNKNTTYTILKKLIDKAAVARREPGFLCSPLIAREIVQKDETERLIDKFWGGSKKAFFAAFVDEQLTEDEINELKSMIEKR